MATPLACDLVASVASVHMVMTCTLPRDDRLMIMISDHNVSLLFFVAKEENI